MIPSLLFSNRLTVKTDGPNYILRSGSLTETAEWILRHALSPNDASEQSARPSAANRPVRFTPADILRLDEQAQRQRRLENVYH